MSERLLVCLLRGGPEFTIMVGGRPYVFEYSRHGYGGPMPVTKTGAERPMGPRHRFWSAVTHWVQQGKQMNPDGTCAWAYPPDPLKGFVQIAPRTWVSREIADRIRRRGGRRAG